MKFRECLYGFTQATKRLWSFLGQLMSYSRRKADEKTSKMFTQCIPSELLIVVHKFSKVSCLTAKLWRIENLWNVELEFSGEWRRNFSRSLATWKRQIAVIPFITFFFYVHTNDYFWRIKVWKCCSSGSGNDEGERPFKLIYLLSIAVIHSISESFWKSNQYLNSVYWWFKFFAQLIISSTTVFTFSWIWCINFLSRFFSTHYRLSSACSACLICKYQIGSMYLSVR